MDAKQTCDTVLGFIKKSNLNWNIVESPFSVTVTIRKSFIKNKDGSSLRSGLEQIHTVPLKIPNDPYSTQTEHLLQQLAAGHGKPNHRSYPTKNNVSSIMQQQALVNPSPYPTMNTHSASTMQQQTQGNTYTYHTQNTLSSSSMQQQALGNTYTYPTKDNLSSSTMQQQALGNTCTYPTQDSISSSNMQQQALGNTCTYPTHDSISSSNMQQQALGMGNPYTYPTQDNLSFSMQQKASVNLTPCPTQTRLKEKTLVNPNPYPTQNTFSSIMEKQALTKANSTNSVQKKLYSIPVSDFSAWDTFPFKCHPEVLSDSDENSDDDGEFKEFMKKYKTELITSDSDKTTDDDDVEFEFLKNLRMKTRPKLKDKETR